MPVTTRDQLRYRAAFNALLPETVTVTRTAAVIPCRITASSGFERLEGLPTFARPRQWTFNVELGTDLVAGDTVTSATKGIYTILSINGPNSYSQGITVLAVQAFYANGTLAIFSTDTVTFRRPSAGNAHTAPIAVTIWPLEQVEKPVGFEDQVMYRVLYPLATSINGIPISANDEIVWAGVPHGVATLLDPIRHESPIPYMLGTFSATHIG